MAIEGSFKRVLEVVEVVEIVEVVEDVVVDVEVVVSKLVVEDSDSKVLVVLEEVPRTALFRFKQFSSKWLDSPETETQHLQWIQACQTYSAVFHSLTQ